MSAHTAPKTRGFSLKCSERTRGHRVSILPRNCSAICVWSKSASKTATRLAPCERNWKMRSGRAILIYVAPTCEFGRLRRWEKDEDDHPFCRASLPCRPASWPRLVHVHADPVSWRFAPKPAAGAERSLLLLRIGGRRWGRACRTYGTAQSQSGSDLRLFEPRDLLQRGRSEEHTSELQSRLHLVCRLLLEKKN